MKAIIFHEQGGIDQLRYEEVPVPTIASSEILVQVKACAVNHLDIRARRDRPEVQPFPHILGSDISGEVAAVGTEVHNVAVGDRVVLAPCIPCEQCLDCLNGDENMCDFQELLGFQTNGGYAEYVKAPAKNAIQISSDLSYVDASAIPIAYLTAWHMLVTRAQVRPGDDVLVLSAGSGVGSAGLQIAKLCGARIFATASTDEKLEHARQMEPISQSTIRRSISAKRFLMQQADEGLTSSLSMLEQRHGRRAWQALQRRDALCPVELQREISARLISARCIRSS